MWVNRTNLFGGQLHFKVFMLSRRSWQFAVYSLCVRSTKMHDDFSGKIHILSLFAWSAYFKIIFRLSNIIVRFCTVSPPLLQLEIIAQNKFISYSSRIYHEMPSLVYTKGNTTCHTTLYHVKFFYCHRIFL